MTVAIFGGSFDPLHVGHKDIIVNALKFLCIDKLFVVPTYLNPFKNDFFAPADLRIKWLKKTFEANKRIEILEYEAEQNRAVPTIETVKFLQKNYNIKKIYLIIGADNLNSLKKWYKYEELSKIVEFVIATRDNIVLPKGLKKLTINAKISSSKLRLNMNSSFIPKSIAKEINKYYTRNKMSQRIDNIVKILDNKKAENIQVIDMNKKDYFVDNVIIATTMGERHSLSLFDDLKKGLDEKFLHVDNGSQWVVIDLGDMLIHLMSVQYRAKYNIEEFLAEREIEMQKANNLE